MAISRWLLQAALRWIPAPLHRSLDAWSQRQASRRRQRRLRLLAERAPLPTK